jgi:redox-sensitive bicupin YhaK (pirin superfamily)
MMWSREAGKGPRYGCGSEPIREGRGVDGSRSRLWRGSTFSDKEDKMARDRRIRKVMRSKPTIEGAGVHLRRAFGTSEVPELDPFLLLDDFRSDDPRYYLKGFPWHPHRGIETITYVLRGKVEHGDSMGNEGVIADGDVQWMTAGSGIIHQEMPKGDESGHMGGFQLWANLPASHKMMDPRYRGLTKHEIPELSIGNGVTIRVMCGEIEGTKGPVTDIVTEPEYLEVTIPGNTEFTHPTKPGHTVFAYVIGGKGCFCREKNPFAYEMEGANYCDMERKPFIGNNSLVVFDDGEQVVVSTDEEGVRFLLISGKPIGEPVAWYGPIVMNTQEELQIAFAEYRNDTFIKYHGKR